MNGEKYEAEAKREKKRRRERVAVRNDIWFRKTDNKNKTKELCVVYVS